MSISRVKPATWGIGDKLTSAEQNQLDTNVTYALDKRVGQTDTLGSVVTLGATGRIIQSVAPAPNADTTYQIDGQVLGVRIGTPNVLTAQRSYTLSNTNAVNGDEISFFFDPVALGSYNVLIKDNGGATLAALGPTGEAVWGEFKFISGAWKLKRLGPCANPTYEFTANDTVVCPQGATRALVFMTGGSGGGGGGAGGCLGGVPSCGGAGGGGARVFHAFVDGLVGGTGYPVVVGAAGAAGTAGAAEGSGGDGGDGGSSSVFGLTATGGKGGAGGVYGGGSGERFAPGGKPALLLRVNARTAIPADGPGPGAGGWGFGSETVYSDRTAYANGGATQFGTGGAGGTNGTGSTATRGGGGGGGGAGEWPGSVGGGGGAGKEIGVAAPAGGSAGTLGGGGGGGGGGSNGDGGNSPSAGLAGGAGVAGRVRIIFLR